MENDLKKKVASLTGIAVVVSGIAYFFSQQRRESLEEPVPTFEPIKELVIPTDSGEVLYIVRPGDSLSEIVYRELGMRNTDSIYAKVKEIQRRNTSLTTDRDVYLMQNGDLLRGKDGLVDIIYPLEEFNGVSR